MTKKVAILIIFFIFFATPVMAQDIQIKINGNSLKSDVAPIIQNSRVMVPFRTIFEAFGASVEWDESSKIVTGRKEGKVISLRINDYTAEVNRVKQTLDSPAIIHNSRTLVPIRFIAENMDLKVDWDANNRMVLIGQTTIAPNKLYNPDGTLLYEGATKNGKLDGYGTLYKDTKVLYKGYFKSGTMDGDGELYSDGKLVFRGKFINNNLTTEGVYYNVITGKPLE